MGDPSLSRAERLNLRRQERLARKARAQAGATNGRTIAGSRRPAADLPHLPASTLAQLNRSELRRRRRKRLDSARSQRRTIKTRRATS